MKLTREEQQMLDGKKGSAVQKSMELLVAVGECYDAERMIPVSSVHLVSPSPINAGKGGTRFIKEMAEKGGKFVVPTTTNPACLDPWAWRELGFTEEIYREQMSLSEAVARMGAYMCNSCTPYLIGHTPRKGEHVAWGESSAVIYANSVLGSRTNREGGPTGLAAALTGRIPASRPAPPPAPPIPEEKGKHTKALAMAAGIIIAILLSMWTVDALLHKMKKEKKAEETVAPPAQEMTVEEKSSKEKSQEEKEEIA